MEVSQASLVSFLYKYCTDGNNALYAQENVTPLFIASEKGHVELVKLLLASGAKPDITKNVSVQ